MGKTQQVMQANATQLAPNYHNKLSPLISKSTMRYEKRFNPLTNILFGKTDILGKESARPHI